MDAARADAGFSLVEALLALAILAILFGPMTAAVSQSQRNARDGLDAAEVVYDAQARMEALLAKNYSSVAVGATNYTVATAGGSYPGTVVVALYDCSGDGTPDADCKQIAVSAAGVVLTALRTNY